MIIVTELKNTLINTKKTIFPIEESPALSIVFYFSLRCGVPKVYMITECLAST